MPLAPRCLVVINLLPSVFPQNFGDRAVVVTDTCIVFVTVIPDVLEKLEKAGHLHNTVASRTLEHSRGHFAFAYESAHPSVQIARGRTARSHQPRSISQPQFRAH